MTTIDPGELIRDVTFSADFNPGLLRWNESVDFLQVDEPMVALGAIRLLGFATPIARTGGIDRSEVVHPLTEFNDLPAENATIDQQGKGVGPRLHNIRQALGGARTRPDFVGVYTFEINPNRIRDLHANQGNRATRIARHGLRIARAAIGNTEDVVQGIHASYDGFDGVRMTIPPHSELRQLEHGVRNPAGVTPQFILIRNPNLLLRKVGEAPAPW